MSLQIDEISHSYHPALKNGKEGDKKYANRILNADSIDLLSLKSMNIFSNIPLCVVPEQYIAIGFQSILTCKFENAFVMQFGTCI